VVILASAPGAAAYAGPAWFKAATGIAAAEVPAARHTVLIDCEADAGIALGALRIGFKRIRFTGSQEAAERLTDIARQQGAVLERAEPAACLDLLGKADPLLACREYLGRNRTEA
jgi:hypothetical protein